MTDDIVAVARQNCCRLCLAPESECLFIFKTVAADKEPLLTKIQACVNIKVNQADRLSARICHACISYLNSWQSFKNRCMAAQVKQLHWMDMAKRTVVQKQNGPHKVSPSQNRRPTMQNRNMSLPYPVKKEPLDDGTLKEDLDPAEFLARHDEEDDNDEISDSTTNIPLKTGPPQILASLGLTQINTVNPFTFLSTELGNESAQNMDFDDSSCTLNGSSSLANDDPDHNKRAACRICNLVFSTQANARRHERNIHKQIIPPAVTVAATSIKLSSSSSVEKKSKIEVTPEMRGIYDYTNPEKYRNLLTDSKLVYIRRYEEFLKQYQDMTCKCCNKQYPAYKQFMVHMRKKYLTLSRNLCFKCLKQFQTKATFLGHLKKKNCINLYKLYLSDDTIPKDGPLQLSVDKMGTKELLTNKEYECKLCNKTFRLKIDFRGHVYEDHADYQKKDIVSGACGFCGTEIEDAAVRRRHYNNMECIVVLHCGSCEEKFENHQQFIAHVYTTHLTTVSPNVEEDLKDISAIEQSTLVENTSMMEQSSSLLETSTISGSGGAASNLRFPQTCKICEQRYNNYYNLLRHMEAKHPDQLPNTYNCDKCEAGFPRQSSLREHMFNSHGTTLPRVRRETYSCRMCTDVFEVREKWITHQNEQHSQYSCCQCNYQDKNVEEFRKHLETHPILFTSSRLSISGNRADILSNGLSDNNPGERDTTTDNEYGSARKKIKLDIPRVPTKECPICHTMFNSNLSLSNHMRAHTAQQNNNKNKLSLAGDKSKSLLKKATNPVKTNRKVGNKKENVNIFGGKYFRRMRCRLCQKRFSTKKNYRLHMLTVHQIRNVHFIRCVVCKAEFTHEKGLNVHMFKVHGTFVSKAAAAATAIANAEQFECDVCGTVYRNQEQLIAHKTSVHGGITVEDEDDRPAADIKQILPASSSSSSEQVIWFQCRYCPSNFDSNKKLAIHINSHEEFDSNDYSCKDCGNVYSGRKSLWVHRYKKHPLIPDPTECELCKKIFFDRNMLMCHLKSHTQEDVFAQLKRLQSNIVQISSISGLEEEEQEQQQEQHDDKDLKPDLDDSHTHHHSHHHRHRNHRDHDHNSNNRVEQVTCTICNLPFSDQDLFDKHIKQHEMELYTDNPLASMFDTEPEDPNKFFLNRIGENGEFTCDICPKTFPILTALKVHRNWHFRSDGKQILADPKTVFRGVTRKKRNSLPIKCSECSSTFVSNSNLRRHVAEIHRREPRKGTESPQVFIEKYLECQKCEKTFQTNYDWVDHKLNHVRALKPDSALEWGCEICGKIVSRKERLVQHMNAHLREDEEHPNGDQGNSQMEFESVTQDSMSSDATDRRSVKSNKTINNLKDGDFSNGPLIIAKEEVIIEQDDNDDEDDDNDNDNDNDNGDDNVNNNDNDIDNDNDNDNDMDDDDDDDDDDDIDEDQQIHIDGEDYFEANENNDIVLEEDLSYDDDSNQNQQSQTSDHVNEEIDSEDEEDYKDIENKEAENNVGSYSCDLCQVYFDTSKQLRRHVTSHFLNGPGSVTLTDVSKEKPNANMIRKLDSAPKTIV